MRTPLPDISQERLIEQIIKFAAFIPNMPDIPPPILADCRKGLCLGFCILLAFKAAQDKGIWWKALLEIISQTPIEQSTLSAKCHLPTNDDNINYSTVYDVFLNVTADVLENQNALQENIANLIQFQTKVAGYFSTEKIFINIILMFQKTTTTQELIALTKKLLNAIMQYYGYLSLKNEFDTNASALDIGDQYEPCAVLLSLLQHNTMTDDITLVIIMTINQNTTFNSLEKLAFFKIIHTYLSIEKNGTLLHLQLSLIKKIETYLYDQSSSQKHNRATLLKLQIFEAENAEEIQNHLNIHLAENNQCARIGTFTEGEFGRCLRGCLEDTETFISLQRIAINRRLYIEPIN